MPRHGHRCRQCGTLWRADWHLHREPAGGERLGYCPTCRDEALLFGLLLGSDLMADGEIDGEWDDDL